MKRFKYIIYLSLWSCPIAGLAQYGGVGRWGEHYSYNKVISILTVGNDVCGVTENGLFYYEKGDGSVRRKTTIQGLSEAGLSASAYDAATQTQVVGYQNGNIDLIQNGRVFNISDVKQKSIAGGKKIHEIVVENSRKVYLACDFGIVVLNLEKQEISETYLIGVNNSNVHVYDLAIGDSLIYAATDKGLLSANRFSKRLNDFSEWHEIPINSQQGLSVKNVCLWNKNLIVCIANADNQFRILRCSQADWHLVDTTVTKKIKVSNDLFFQLREAEEEFLFEMVCYDTNFQISRRYGLDDRERLLWGLEDVYMDKSGELWLADQFNGIRRLDKTWTFVQNICPRGPNSNGAFALYHSPSRLYVARGSVSSNTWTQGFVDFEVNVLQDGSWKSYNNQSLASPYPLTDAVAVVEHPQNQNMFVAASWALGVVQVDANGSNKFYNDTNSTLQWYYWNDTINSIRCGDVKFDKKNQLWVTNAFVENRLHKRTSDGQWTAYQLPFDEPKNFIIDYYDQLWICTQHKLLFFRETTSGFDVLSANLNLGNEQTVKQVNCLAEDKNGYVWLGTDRGILVNYTSKKLFESPIGTESTVEFKTIVYDGRPLLENENITAVVVDGADRKWIGTSSSGVFLVSADGKETVHQFNTDNSPLNSNTITALAINPKTGEVYIGTDKGLMSYGGDATRASTTKQNIVIFPNPVRSDFAGEISICGLVQDAKVHITDVNGRLVFATTAKGGMATWNGHTHSGQRVKAGVYVVFSSDANGDVTAVRKIFINK